MADDDTVGMYPSHIIFCCFIYSWRSIAFCVLFFKLGKNWTKPANFPFKKKKNEYRNQKRILKQTQSKHDNSNRTIEWELFCFCLNVVQCTVYSQTDFIININICSMRFVHSCSALCFGYDRMSYVCNLKSSQSSPLSDDHYGTIIHFQ